MEKGGSPERIEMAHFVDTIRDNCLYRHNAVVTEKAYKGDWNALMRGEEVPCEWDDNGVAIAWDVLSSDDLENV